jgi:hypothetical protein
MMPKDKPQAETTGDGGAREKEVKTAIERVEELVDAIDLDDEKKIVSSCHLFFVDLYKSRPRAWDQLSQDEQRDLSAALEHNAKELVRQVVEAIARNGREPIRAVLESYTEKDGVKVSLKVKTFSEEEALAAVIGLHKAQGKSVLITVASADDFNDGPVDVTEPDQRALGFESGSDEVDLEEAASDPENLKTGDKAAFAGASGTVRINLANGWVQFLDSEQPDLDGNWQDMREAKPEELAAERERTADFEPA